MQTIYVRDMNNSACQCVVELGCTVRTTQPLLLHGFENMRRGPGIVALDRKIASNDQYTSISQQRNELKLAELNKRIDDFSSALRSFAVRHQRDIRRNPQFRHAFQRMCANMMVDPLAGHPTSFDAGGRLGHVVNLWSQFTGLDDWQYELGVQIVDVCISTRPQNGGIISMDALIDGVMRLRQCNSTLSLSSSENVEWKINEEDIERSIQVLKPLGCGYEVFDLLGAKMIRTMARELSSDTMHILNVLSSQNVVPRDCLGNTYITPGALASCYGNDDVLNENSHWSPERAKQALDDMLLNDGTLWLDIIPTDVNEKPEQNRQRYYAFSLFSGEPNSEFFASNGTSS